MIHDGAEASAPLLGEPPAVELMNTVRADRDGVHDTLATPEQTLAWLRTIRSRLTPPPSAVNAWLDAAQPEEVAAVAHRLRVLRDGLRRLAAEVTGDPRPAAVSATPDRRGAGVVKGQERVAAVGCGGDGGGSGVTGHLGGEPA